MSAEPPISGELWSQTPPDVQTAILAVIGRLEQRIAELEARLSQNSSTSSKPPSTDPFGVQCRPPRRPAGI